MKLPRCRRLARELRCHSVAIETEKEMIVMRRAGFFAAFIFVVLGLSSCSRQPAEKRQATVMLQDGSQITGTVAASSAEEITLAGDDNVTRTIPMSQVKSVQYAEQHAGAAQAPDSGTTSTPKEPARPSSAPPA